MGPSRDSNTLEANPSKNQQPFTEPGALERISNLFLVQGDVEYRIGKKLGEGSFGVLYEGERLSGGTSIPVALKFEPRTCQYPQLQDEYRIYKVLKGGEGFPRVYFFSRVYLHNVLILDQLGKSLEDLFNEGGRKFSLKTVLLLARQLLERFQFMHEKNYIHRDIKPENLLIGMPGTSSSNTIHVIDVGLAKQYQDPKTKRHIIYRERTPLLGTARYMSINTHLGREQSRRDDLEALGYIFLYFLRGGLPWQGIKAGTKIEKYWKIGEKKQKVPIQELCEGFPPELAEYLAYVRELGFEGAPDYEYLQGLFVRALENAGLSDDGIFEWMDAGDTQLEAPEIRFPPGPSEAGIAPSSPRQKEPQTADSILPRRGPLGWPKDANVDLPSAY
ncbi:casein kinase I, variant 3 [Rhypophila sp. PSN 637]